MRDKEMHCGVWKLDYLLVIYLWSVTINNLDCSRLEKKVMRVRSSGLGEGGVKDAAI